MFGRLEIVGSHPNVVKRELAWDNSFFVGINGVKEQKVAENGCLYLMVYCGQQLSLRLGLYRYLPDLCATYTNGCEVSQLLIHE